MHDLHEADRILKIALEKAEESGLRNIRSINVELGSVVEHGQEILPENLRFNLKMLARGTMAEGWQVRISRTKEDSWKITEIEGDK